MTQQARLLLAAGLLAAVWGVAHKGAPYGHRTLLLAVTAAAAVGWLGWLAGDRLGRWVLLAALGLTAVTGGVVIAIQRGGAGLAFPAAAAYVAASGALALSLPLAATVAALGIAAIEITPATLGAPGGSALGYPT
ncbi:MAG: hypothetical protein M3O55_01175, partial [Actinomycetota bacterium]|nr:hypothetical protein [Actinomycetota bacterium]